ncbi:unnamed protein product [Heligmosomoides polygyrus]|uniref:Glypican-6 n=1 Tax=Heligmosomoides polygyrus TaxID=6339 RepID=A0A183GPK6_HELPZ|nr:unnamed protein product [Heligmosomoides polygyrus]
MLYSKGTHFCSLLVFVKLALAADISLNRWPNKGAKELCCERSACTRAISNPHSLLFGPDAYASSLPALFDSTQYRVWEWCGFTDDFSRSKENSEDNIVPKSTYVCGSSEKLKKISAAGRIGNDLINAISKNLETVSMSHFQIKAKKPETPQAHGGDSCGEGRSTQTDSYAIVVAPPRRRKSEAPVNMDDIEEREALYQVIEDALGETIDRYSRIRANQIIANKTGNEQTTKNKTQIMSSGVFKL